MQTPSNHHPVILLFFKQNFSKSNSHPPIQFPSPLVSFLLTVQCDMDRSTWGLTGAPCADPSAWETTRPRSRAALVGLGVRVSFPSCSRCLAWPGSHSPEFDGHISHAFPPSFPYENVHVEQRRTVAQGVPAPVKPLPQSAVDVLLFSLCHQSLSHGCFLVSLPRCVNV